MIATFLQILTFFNPVPESTPSLFRHPYQKASLYPACPRFSPIPWFRPCTSPSFPPPSDPQRPFSGVLGLLTILLNCPAHQYVHFPPERPSTHAQLPRAPPPLLCPALAALPSPAKLYPPAPGCVALPADMATGSAPPANYPTTTFPSLPPPTPLRTAFSGREARRFRLKRLFRLDSRSFPGVGRDRRQVGRDLPVRALPLRKTAAKTHVKAELGRGGAIFVVGKLVTYKTIRLSQGIQQVSPKFSYIRVECLPLAGEGGFSRFLPTSFSYLFRKRKMIRPNFI